MFLATLALIFGIALLVYSADEFTKNGAKIATLLNISPLIIGLLIFGFGTSAPEIIVSGFAAYQGNKGISIGNAIGSNIFNISLVLGITAILAPVKVAQNILKKEWVFLIFVSSVSWILLLDLNLGILDGVILLSFLAMFLAYSFIQAKKSGHHEFENLLKETIAEKKEKPLIIWIKLLMSLVVLLVSANITVWGGKTLAQLLGVPDLIIGLTIIAFGTSLPELAVSISAALKKQHDMIVGNIIGSNLFNTLAVLSIPAIVSPGPIDAKIIDRDYPIMFLLTVLLFMLSFNIHKKYTICRVDGAILLIVFTFYLYLLS